MTRSFALALALALSAAPAQAQLKGVRFEIESARDTLLSFKSGTEKWIKAGMTGRALDPKRRDILVATLRIVGVDSVGLVTAAVTGQTTAVTTEHVVLMRELTSPWFRRKSFWVGVLLGTLTGVGVGTQL